MTLKVGMAVEVVWRGEMVRLEIARNRVVEVLGRNESAADLRNFLALDGARRNVAELGLGCNPRARVWGNVLEDEKAGPHIALGRSEHIGGTLCFDDVGMFEAAKLMRVLCISSVELNG